MLNYKASALMFVGLFLLLINSPAFSYEAKVCNACGGPALEFQARDSGNGDYYFYDFSFRKLTHLRVEGIVVPLSSESNYYVTATNGRVTNIPVTSSEQLDFNASQTFVDSNGGLVDYSIDVLVKLSTDSPAIMKEPSFTSLADGGASVNAFDVVSTPLARTVVGNYLDRNSFVLGLQIGAANYLNYMLNNAIIRSPINIYTRVVFPDNTSAVYLWNFDVRGFEYVPGTAKDVLGQRIPENSVDAAGGINNSQIYIYPATPAGQMSGLEMIDRLNSFGMGLSYPINQNGYSIACTNVGGVTNCVIVTKTS